MNRQYFDQYCMPKRDAVDEHKRLVRVLTRGDRTELDRERDDQQTELDEMLGSGNTIRRMMGRPAQVAPVRREPREPREPRRSSAENRAESGRVMDAIRAEERERRGSDPRVNREDEERAELERRAYADLSPVVRPFLRDNLREMIKNTSDAELRRAYGKKKVRVFG